MLSCDVLVPPLPPRFMEYPPDGLLSEVGSGAADAIFDALDLPTLRIWALTCDS